MKNLKLLNKKNLSIIIIFIFGCISAVAEENPVDIWNIEKEKNNNNSVSNSEQIVNIKDSEESEQSSIYESQSINKIETISLDKNLDSKEVKIYGLYDPEDYGLNIEMWINSDGDQIKNLFSNLSKINLSKDAKEILNISILTNAYYPKKNITENEFLEIKSNWLIKNSDLDLIERYLIKNQIFNKETELSRYLVDQYLSQSNIEKSCEIFSKNKQAITNEYLSKFNIYCLINSGKKNEAQLIFDLKKELGFKDKYFEKKIDYLFGYTSEIDEKISENSILDFHLAHRTNPKFSFEPNENTSKLIWKYLSTSNLLYNINEISIEDLDKISKIEKAVHEKNYSEKDLFQLYKRFQFNIDQLLNVKDSYKSLTNIEAKAIIYQKILIESEIKKKLELLKILKELFIKDNIGNAFDEELKRILNQIEEDKIPSNFTSFYKTYAFDDQSLEKKIKYNNDIMHQSKLVNYFNGDYAKSKIEKDVNNFLKKIKKNKKYNFSKKDIIFVEALKADGVKILKKYDNLYEINESEMPTDIQIMINNNELGSALLRIVEVIGQDEIDRIDDDTMYFIISTLNQLNIDLIRNRILLKVLPLKV